MSSTVSSLGSPERESDGELERTANAVVDVFLTTVKVVKWSHPAESRWPRGRDGPLARLQTRCSKHCAGHGLAKPEDEAADRNGSDRSQRSHYVELVGGRDIFIVACHRKITLLLVRRAACMAEKGTFNG
jgi:hypothetical protein